MLIQKLNKFFLLPLSFLCIPAIEIPAQPVIANHGQSIKGLEDYLDRASSFGFSGSIVVASGKKVILRKNYGLVDKRKNNPVQSNTVFSLASLDKQFISAAILKLEEQGKLSINDSVYKIFGSGSTVHKSITIESLLSHTSGLGDDYWEDYPDKTKSAYVKFLLSEKPLAYQTGGDWVYSNSGYIILEEVIEKVSGIKYEDYLRKNIFEPCGMRSTGYPSSIWNKNQVAKYQYWSMDLDSVFIDARDLLTRPPYLWVMMSTADDMLKWYQSLASNSILTPHSTEKLFRPVRNGYALGWNVSKSSRGTTLIHHGGSGSGIGMNATFRWFKEENIFFCILSNSSTPAISADYFCSSIENILFGGSVEWPPIADSPKSFLQSVLGQYEFPDGSKWEILRSTNANKILVRSADPNAINQLRYPDMLVPDKTRLSQDSIALRVIGSMFNDNYEPLRMYLNKYEGFEEAKSQYKEAIKNLSQLGVLEEISTVHQRFFYFEDILELHSFIGLRFKGGTQILRVIHFPEGSISINADRYRPPYEMLIVPTLSGNFETWDFKSGVKTGFTFSINAEGKTGVFVRTKYGNVYCKKIK